MVLLGVGVSLMNRYLWNVNTWIDYWRREYCRGEAVRAVCYYGWSVCCCHWEWWEREDTCIEEARVSAVKRCEESLSRDNQALTWKVAIHCWVIFLPDDGVDPDHSTIVPSKVWLVIVVGAGEFPSERKITGKCKL